MQAAVRHWSIFLLMHDAGVGLCPLKKQKTVFGVLDEPPKTAKCCRLLSYLSLYDSNLATIVAASGAYSVVDVECTAVAALSKCRSYCSVVGATLESTSLWLSSFRMCHCSIEFCIIILGVLRTIYKMILSNILISKSEKPIKWCNAAKPKTTRLPTSPN